jgi:hypothetical protein
MQIIAVDLNNVYVIDVNDGINAKNVILTSLWRYCIESCNRVTGPLTSYVEMYQGSQVGKCAANSKFSHPG